MNLDKVSRALYGHRLGWPIRYEVRVTSTQDVAREAALAGAAEGLLVLAEEQTAGRGRAGRSWWAPRGSAVLSSLLLRPSLPKERLGYIGMIAGLAVMDALNAMGVHPVHLKWPNDVLLHGKKVAGILLESVWEGDHLNAVILGVGINVNAHIPPTLPFASTATSLADEGHDVSREDLIIAYVLALERYYARVHAGWSPVSEWARHLHTLGKRVRVLEPESEWEGVAVGVTEEGALQVRRGETLVVLRSADVSVRTVGETP